MLKISLYKGLATLLLCGWSYPAGADIAQIGASPGDVAPLTLVRLSFWVPSGQMEAFEQVYDARMVPLLQKRDAVESSARGRSVAEGVFSRLYAVETPSARFRLQRSMNREPDLLAVLDELEKVAVVDTLRYRVDLFRGQAIPGKMVKAGSGTRNGAWHSLRVTDGLPVGSIYDIVQEAKGQIWFASTGDGVVRYDGDRFARFGEKDVLAGKGAYDIFQDRDGNLWVGTDGGVSRFDDMDITTYSVADGLIDNVIHEVYQDRDGQMWFGSNNSGVTRFDGEIFVNYSVESGLPLGGARSMLQDRDGTMWFAGNNTASRFDGEQFESFVFSSSGIEFERSDIYQDRAGALWFCTGQEGINRFADGVWTNFTIPGMSKQEFTSAIEDANGHMWFGNWGGGIARFDGKGWTIITAANGLVGEMALCVMEDRDGHYWWGFLGGGVTRYDGFAMTHFGPWNGFPNSFFFDVLADRRGNIWYANFHGFGRVEADSSVVLRGGHKGWRTDSLYEDRDGDIWFGMWNGMWRYADGQLISYPDSLLPALVFHMLEDKKGRMWFAAPWKRNGVWRYDGEDAVAAVQFDMEDGLAGNRVHSLAEDHKGRIWISTDAGISLYDDGDFTTLQKEDGLAANQLYRAVFTDAEGRVWIGGSDYGVWRFDGERFELFSDEVGLPSGWIQEIMQDHRGHLWFSSYGAGISHYDGLVFQNISASDGLVTNAVQAADEDSQGNIWIAADGALTRYRPGSMPPGIRIVELISDRPHGVVSSLTLPSSQDFLRIEFRGHSLSTPAERLAYVYRLGPMEAEWQVTRESQVSYGDLPVGEYLFEVKAVDRDLNYSEAAQVRIVVEPDYGQFALWGSLGLALMGLIFASGVAVRRRRALLHEQQARLEVQEALNRELEEELQTARQLQMSLMPTESPQIAGLDIAGRCETVNHVGGDFYQYFENDGKLSVCLADVTGHAMEAAVPVMMFSGVLKSQMEMGESVETLFSRLNRTLHDSLDSRTFVCFTMAEVDVETRSLRLANGGCPYPYHYRAETGEVLELEVDAYPLGVRPSATYATVETTLSVGDYLIFCSDGLIEAADADEEIFGFEQLALAILSSCVEGLSAGDLIDRLIAKVQAFAGEVPPGDDMTVVVLKVEGA